MSSNGLRILACASALAAAFWAAPASAMTYTLIPVTGLQCRPSCPAVIQATGEITHTTAEEFVDFVQRATKAGQVGRTIFIHSPGGNVGGALRLGAALRVLQATVVVGTFDGGTISSGSCYSACVWAIAGGKRRLVPAGSRVGVHGSRNSGVSQRDIAGSGSIDFKHSEQDYIRGMTNYLRMMGVDPKLVVLAESIPHESIRVLSPTEIRRYRLGESRAP